MTQKSPLEQRFGLSDKTVLVTGGGRGIGRAIAEAMIDAGARVMITGRNVETLAKTAEELGENCAFKACDAANEAEMEALAGEMKQTYGTLDGLVNNAGINPYYKRSEHTSVKEWNDIIEVNLTGVFLSCRIFGSMMLEQQSGSIVNITSIAAHNGLPRSAAYCATKAGVEGMSRSLALDWASKGVRVNSVAPGYVATDLTAGLRENSGLNQSVVDKTPLGRVATGDEIAGAALFLISPASSYMTGQSIIVDGGWVAV